MNRAWIPAGALAGVSVAGLIALGPLTNSLGTPVSFPPTAATASSVNPPPKTALAEVPVSISLHVVGKIDHAALKRGRGGRAIISAATNSTEGAVALKVRSGKTVTHSTVSSHSTTSAQKTVTPKATVKPKTVVKRQTSIGDVGESNPDHGLAGQSQQTSSGGQNATPKPAP